ncbi:TOG array regulator of axonemal microtubules protein 1 [Rhynochetos jubatus]
MAGRHWKQGGKPEMEIPQLAYCRFAFPTVCDDGQKAMLAQQPLRWRSGPRLLGGQSRSALQTSPRLNRRQRASRPAAARTAASRTPAGRGPSGPAHQSPRRWLRACREPSATIPLVPASSRGAAAPPSPPRACEAAPAPHGADSIPRAPRGPRGERADPAALQTGAERPPAPRRARPEPRGQAHLRYGSARRRDASLPGAAAPRPLPISGGAAPGRGQCHSARREERRRARFTGARWRGPSAALSFPAALAFCNGTPTLRGGGGRGALRGVCRPPPPPSALWAVPRKRRPARPLATAVLWRAALPGRGRLRPAPPMAAALALPPPARAMEQPADPERGVRGGGGGSRLPPCLSPDRGGRAAGEGEELPRGPRPALCGEVLRGRCRGPGRPPRPPAAASLRALTPPPAARRGPDELSRSLAWLGGPGPAGQREEEPGAEPFPPAGRQRLPAGRLVGEGTAPPPPTQHGGAGLKFGLLPPELHACLLDQEDYKNRTRAVEELKRVVGGASRAAVTSTPAPSLLGLISFLYTLLDDSNFKVVLGALEVIRLLALRLGDQVQAFLAPLVSAAAKVLGDNKLAIRQEYNRLFLQLMKAAGARPVLSLLLQQEHLQHKNSKVREEVVNICIVALLTYPGEELDLAKLAFGLAPALVDSKRRVRHAAMEAFAVLASSMGPGRTTLFKAVDAVELEDNGDGVMHAVQARLARKTLPKLVDQGFVEYAVPLPSSGQNRGSCLPPGADTDWLLMGSRTQSAHSYCGYHAREDVLPNAGSHGAFADQGLSPRRVLSAGKGKNKLPWENEHAGDREGGSGVQMPLTEGVEQFSTSSDFLHSPELRPSQGLPVSDELFFSTKRASRNLFQNSIDFNSEHSSVCAGAMGSHQPQVSGKCGTLGYTRGKSGSVDSDLQFLGLNNCQQDKVFASLNFPSKTQRGFCSQAEHTVSFQGPNASQGAFILPSYPLSSPRNSPKHVPAPADSPKNSPGNAMNFSNSWPLKSFRGLPKPGAQKQLLGHKSGDGAGESLLEKHSPVQLKPTLVRHPATCRGLTGARPVPPIPRLASPLPDKIELNLAKWRNEESEDVSLSEVDRRLAAGLAELSVDGEQVDQEEMQNSLRSLRNSAAKKRAKLCSNFSDLESPDSALKLDVSVDSPSHASSPSTGSCGESGVYSQESLASPVSAVPQRRRMMSDTFPLLGSKPQPARVPSARKRDPGVAERSSGTGLAESTSSCPPVNNLDCTSPRVLSEDAVEIVGEGVLGSPPSARKYSQSIPNGDDQAVREETGPSSGICGRSTQQSGASRLRAENEKEVKVAMSKSAQDKMRQKKKGEQESGHEERQESKDLEEKEESPWEGLKLDEPEKMTTEKLGLCGDVLTSSRNVPLSLENVALNPSFRRTSSLKKTKCSALLDSDEIPAGARGRYKDRTPSVTHSPEVMDPSELQPFAKPETALAEALTLLADDDWEKKIEGLNFVRCLSAYHAAVMTAKLHETSLAVAQEVKNLRSGVSRAAVVCLGDLFTHLKKSMDQELDNTVKVLLHKAGESNTFIREEVDKALKAMVNNVTPARALCSLINGGQSHLHSAVRRCTAQHLSDIVERMGPERILAGAKAVADRLFPAVARFAQDSSQQTRYYGRKMLFSMMTHPDFDRTLEKYVPAKDLPYIKESVSNLRDKGLGEMPLDAPSARGRRSHTNSVGHSRSSSTSRDALNVTDRDTAEACEVTRKTAPRNSLESEEYVKEITGLLNGKDFRDRIHGIRQLLADTENHQGLVLANIVKIFDAFKARLHDSNSKVNQVALESMHKMIPLLKDNLAPVINMLIPAMVDNNLNSKNPGIYAAATNVIEALCQHVDNYLLLQPFCTKAQFLNGKAKQDMTEKLADLVTELYPRKPCAVEQKVPAVLWHLLGNMTNSGSLPGAGGNIRAAAAKLAKALFAQMGPSLLTHAASQPPHIRRSLEEFLEIAT